MACFCRRRWKNNHAFPTRARIQFTRYSCQYSPYGALATGSGRCPFLLSGFPRAPVSRRSLGWIVDWPAEQPVCTGLDPACIQNVLALVNERQMPLLIETDGSRRHPVKAPADHGLQFPDLLTSWSSQSGYVPWDVHYPMNGSITEIFSAISKSPQGSPILPETVRRVLCHPSGSLKDLPEGTRRVVLLIRQTPQNCIHRPDISPQNL